MGGPVHAVTDARMSCAVGHPTARERTCQENFRMRRMPTGMTPLDLTVHHTTDAGGYLDHAGDFLRRRPVEHSVLLSAATSHLEERPVDDAEPNLWLWVEEAGEVVAAAQHTPPHGAYLSTGPAEAMHLIAQTLRELRPALSGVGGISDAPREFAADDDLAIACKQARKVRGDCGLPHPLAGPDDGDRGRVDRLEDPAGPKWKVRVRPPTKARPRAPWRPRRTARPGRAPARPRCPRPARRRRSRRSGTPYSSSPRSFSLPPTRIAPSHS